MHGRRGSFKLLPADSAGDDDLAEAQVGAPFISRTDPPGPIKRPRRSSLISDADTVSQSGHQTSGEPGAGFLLPKGRQRKRHRQKGRLSYAGADVDGGTLEGTEERTANGGAFEEEVVGGPGEDFKVSSSSEGPAKKVETTLEDLTPQSVLELTSDSKGLSQEKGDPRTEKSGVSQAESNGGVHTDPYHPGGGEGVNWPGVQGFAVPGLELPSSPIYDDEVTHALVPNKPRLSRELSIDLRTAAEKEEDELEARESSDARTVASDHADELERRENPSELQSVVSDEAVGQSSSVLHSPGDVRQRSGTGSPEASTLTSADDVSAELTPAKGSLVPVFSSPLGTRQSSGFDRRGYPLNRHGSVASTPDGRGAPTSTVTTPRKGFDSPQSFFAAKQELLPPMDLSVRGYLAGEVASGSTLRNSALSAGDERRERVYNTMFHVPWRVELLIDVGFLVCLDSFLSLFTIMPYRFALFFWRLAFRSGLKRRPRVDELCDAACMVVLAVGTVVLHSVDISFIYHWIRGQAIIKLYVVFNVLEIMDKLLQSFGADVLQVLFNTAGRVSLCSAERLPAETARLLLDQGVATACYDILPATWQAVASLE
ncbi:hypothetical protein KFL_005300090 [Klebsormidium nitens]|uniref:Uncharacterized protein n=1 Tax=Klebsormidium nitens TaxID=105231 RepID=A0A1Y1IF30_KLENI|nr:hypothetical protein KFL_005300090 [Klebsormidium nitens]|eukprot:GAQ89505.1 hypothetical protein KFL_005300090 [Klebsormidium nitens]